MNLIVAIIIVAAVGAIPLGIIEYFRHEEFLKEIEEIVRRREER